MLAKRIIPTLLCRGRTLVKGERFNSWRSVGMAAQAVRIHQARGVDELVLLDISATAEKRGPDLDLVRELSEKCFMPITVGGGVRTLTDVKALLHAGADKVAIGTAAIECPGLITEIASAVGRQAVVVSIDVKQGKATSRAGAVASQRDALLHSILSEKNGAGEILLQSVDRDGTMQGYDLGLIREISHAAHIPVIASGGCGTYEHMLEAIKAGADAVAAGAMFQFSDRTPRGAAEFLQSHGVEVRL